MGLDMSYQALPADCDLIARAGPGRPLEGMLSFMFGWFRRGIGPPPERWPEGAIFWRELCELAARHPGLEKRNFELHRSWDQLHYLLSANRRECPPWKEDTLLDKAVRGSDVEVDERVTHVTPQEVALIAAILEPMSIEDLRPHYLPAVMANHGIYKFHADPEQPFEESAALYFPAFRAFYLEAAQHGEGVLVHLE